MFRIVRLQLQQIMNIEQGFESILKLPHAYIEPTHILSTRLNAWNHKAPQSIHARAYLSPHPSTAPKEALSQIPGNLSPYTRS